MNLSEAVVKILGEIMPSYTKKSETEWAIELYADYRDEIDSKTALEILEADIPEDHLYEMMSDWYSEQEADEIDEIAKKVMDRFCEEKPDEAEVLDCVRDHVYCDYPFDHYLDQGFKVPVMVDTGDGNYDYVLNNIVPGWGGCEAEDIDDDASLVWLVEQQGYTKSDLATAISEGTENKFLQSIVDELANETGSMNTLTFLTTMTLRQLINLNAVMKTREKDGHMYDNRCYPDVGTITINKDAFTGLFDAWNGGGSMFEIQLEKDVVLPIKFIRSALPDGGDGYGVDAVYGFTGKAWMGNVSEVIPATKL